MNNWESYSRKTGRLGNEKRFLSMKEALARAAGEDGEYAPEMEGFPQESTYVYRSADIYGTCSYYRLNTCFYVYADRKFANKEEAYGYLEALGICRILDEAKGSAILMEPAGEDYGWEDMDAFGRLESSVYGSMRNQYGGFGRVYMAGIGKGADFIHNMLAEDRDYGGRMAGVLTIGGHRQNRPVGRMILHPQIPMFLVRPFPEEIDFYKTVNCADIRENIAEDVYSWTSAENPTLKIIVDNRTCDFREYVEMAWKLLFSHTQRIPITPGIRQFFDCNRYALGARYEPKELGITVVSHEEGEFLADTEIDRWYEYFPEKAQECPMHTMPLVLLLHGDKDDPRALMEQCGWLELMAKEKFAVVAPEHQYIRDVTPATALSSRGKVRQLDKVVAYMLEKYPFLDERRVYVTGFSRGGENTVMSLLFNSERFAAAVPMAVLMIPELQQGEPEEWEQTLAQCTKEPIPTMIVMDEMDPITAQTTGCRSRISLPMLHTGLNLIRQKNGYDNLAKDEYDFTTYPFWGFPLGNIRHIPTRDTMIHVGDLVRADGQVWIQCAVFDGLSHALYYDYAGLAWTFMKGYSRK